MSANTIFTKSEDDLLQDLLAKKESAERANLIKQKAILAAKIKLDNLEYEIKRKNTALSNFYDNCKPKEKILFRIETQDVEYEEIPSSHDETNFRKLVEYNEDKVIRVIPKVTLYYIPRNIKIETRRHVNKNPEVYYRSRVTLATRGYKSPTSLIKRIEDDFNTIEKERQTVLTKEKYNQIALNLAKEQFPNHDVKIEKTYKKYATDSEFYVLYVGKFDKELMYMNEYIAFTFHHDKNVLSLNYYENRILSKKSAEFRKCETEFYMSCIEKFI
jgi:hypothetical protein